MNQGFQQVLCPRCGQQTAANYAYCLHCGSDLRAFGKITNIIPPGATPLILPGNTASGSAPTVPQIICPRCNTSVGFQAAYCGNCGLRLFPVRHTTSKTLLIGGVSVLLILLLLIGLLTGLMITQRKSSGMQQTPGTFQGTPNASTTAPAQSVTPVASQQATVIPSPSSTATPTPQPKTKGLLYEAGCAKGWDGWQTNSEWSIQGCYAVSRGMSWDLQHYFYSPFSVDATGDYAVEAKILYTSGCFGFTLRGQPQDQAPGYGLDFCDDHGQLRIRVAGAIAVWRYWSPPDTTIFHVYRLQAVGPHIKILFDGAVLLSLDDYQYASGPTVSFSTYGGKITISDVKIIGL
jgi:hypothetical protein